MLIKFMNSINNAPPIINNFTFDDIPRCPNCNLIPSLKLNYNENTGYINYKCENGHKKNILLEEYMSQYNKFSLFKEICNECKKNQKEVKGDFSYCSSCKKYFCSLCSINHFNKDNHNTINLKRYDSFCKIHSNLYCFYCVECEKNLCIYCKNEHESHDLIDLSQVNYSDDSKKKIEEEIKNIEKKIRNLDEVKNNIISQIEQFKKSSEYEMNFIKILFFTYQYEENLHNLNYNVIQNLKNFEKTFKKNKIELYEKVYDEGNKYISLLQNLENIKFNSFNNNFKILNNHSSYISYLSQLNDGRLISSSGDYTLNIYKINSFELQLSIKEHTNQLGPFIQLRNGKIISCSDDKTMKVINLIGKDKYKIEQTLEGHHNFIWNVIEIKENELISISYDKTIKVWKLNNKKFECFKTITFQSSCSGGNILKLNENEFVTSSCDDKCIKFWNSNNYSKISIINNIEIQWTYQLMCLLNDNILCIGGNNSKGFYLIDINTHKIIKNILGPKIIYCINKCLDGLFLCSIVDENGNNSLVKYKYENEDLKKIVEKENAHDNNIYTCIELRDGTIASGGEDNLIKLWD